MITLGLKIGFVAFVACVTFVVLVLILITLINSIADDAVKRQKKKTSGKVTKMPRRDDNEQ